MKRSALLFSFLFSSIILCLTAPVTALGQTFGQKGCQLDIVGTWKAASPDGANPVLYRFAPDSTVTVLSQSGSELREVARATYKLDNPKAPKAIILKAAKAGGGLAEGTTSIGITGYDDATMTCVRSGYEPTRWVKVDPHRYFIVLAGRTGVFYDRSGPAFPMLIKMDEGKTQVDAVGIYSVRNSETFGTVPAEAYNEFMKETSNDSDVMLRLEITGAQYERGLKVLRHWERRVQEGTLLYPDLSLDNVLLVKQVTETLNQCSQKIKLHNLDWGIEDHISDKVKPTHIPFRYFKELRRLNESLHVRDEAFQEHTRMRQAGQ